MKSIFNVADFKLCIIPVPNGYPQSQTHCGVQLMHRRVIMTSSPYPQIYYKSQTDRLIKGIVRKITNGRFFSNTPGEIFENPCIYIQDGPERNIFKLMSQDALMSAPNPVYGLPAYNSDPDIFIYKDELMILNRQVYRKSNGGPLTVLYLLIGRCVNDYFFLDRIYKLFETEYNVISPCLARWEKEYYIIFIDSKSYNDGKTFDGIWLIKSTSLDEVSVDIKQRLVIRKPEQLLPWHLSLFQYDNHMYAIVLCVEENLPQKGLLYLGEFSNDLSELTIYDSPLSSINSYRSSALVDEQGIFHLYLSTVHFNKKVGKAVDGREILYTHATFADVLSKIKTNV